MRVPPSVAARLSRYDKNARLTWGGDRWRIEHRGRDGRWHHVGSVAPERLGDGGAVIEALYKADMWRRGGAAAVAREMEEQDAREQERLERQRRQEWIDQAKEAYDELHHRLGHAVYNAGLPEQVTS